jgi:hypothetical protein
MHKVTCGISMSLDAFVAGPNQSFEKPFGDIPENFFHHWMFDEPEKHQAELDALRDAGAFIMGRTPRHLMVHIDGAIKLANPLVSGQADPYTE